MKVSRRRRWALAAIGCSVVLALAARARADALSEAVAAMRPAEEAWQRIPWRTDLARARLEAAKTGKPLFIWAMNGNPLGCT